METCFEYLGCQNRDCVMYGIGRPVMCWQVEGTLCNHHGIEIMRGLHGDNKEAACARSSCIYYRFAKAGETIRRNVD